MSGHFLPFVLMTGKYGSISSHHHQHIYIKFVTLTWLRLYNKHIRLHFCWESAMGWRNTKYFVSCFVSQDLMWPHLKSSLRFSLLLSKMYESWKLMHFFKTGSLRRKFISCAHFIWLCLLIYSATQYLNSTTSYSDLIKSNVFRH